MIDQWQQSNRGARPYIDTPIRNRVKGVINGAVRKLDERPVERAERVRHPRKTPVTRPTATDMPSQVLEAVKVFLRSNRYSPTVREIVRQTHCSSTSMVSYWLTKLEEQGYITRTPHCARAIIVTEKGWRNDGRVVKNEHE